MDPKRRKWEPDMTVVVRGKHGRGRHVLANMIAMMLCRPHPLFNYEYRYRGEGGANFDPKESPGETFRKIEIIIEDVMP